MNIDQKKKPTEEKKNVKRNPALTLLNWGFSTSRKEHFSPRHKEAWKVMGKKRTIGRVAKSLKVIGAGTGALSLKNVPKPSALRMGQKIEASKPGSEQKLCTHHREKGE